MGWHDVECASYTADLSVWRELAEEAGGPVLDVGCGTGRVALELAGAGHRVTAFDTDPSLVSALRERARQRRLEIDSTCADARSFSHPGRFGLAVAAMQVVQLLGGGDGRGAMLRCVHDHLQPGGRLAAALADPFEGLSPDEALPPLPDVREEDGWVLSSRPLAVRTEHGALAIDRLRQAVSPGGELSEELVTVRLDQVSPAELEKEARSFGYEPLERRRVPETADHVGSTVVVLEAR